MDMSKEFPAQIKGRGWWIVDTVREHQGFIGELLMDLYSEEDVTWAKEILTDMKPMDRDAILQPGGILNDEQIELLK